MIIHLPSCPVSKHDHYVIDSIYGCQAILLFALDASLVVVNGTVYSVRHKDDRGYISGLEVVLRDLQAE